MWCQEVVLGDALSLAYRAERYDGKAWIDVTAQAVFTLDGTLFATFVGNTLEHDPAMGGEATIFARLETGESGGMRKAVGEVGHPSSITAYL